MEEMNDLELELELLKLKKAKVLAQQKSNPRQKYDELDSAGRGFAQGVSFGLRDEAAGLLESPYGAAKEIANKFGAGFTDDDVARYKAERDESRKLDEYAAQDNPLSYGAGAVGGAVTTAFVPGMGALNAAKGAGLGVTSAKAALQGGLAGVGSSNEEDLSGIAKDTAWGTGLGALGGAAGYGVGKLGQKVAGKFSSSVDDVLNQGDEAATRINAVEDLSTAPKAPSSLEDMAVMGRKLPSDMPETPNVARLQQIQNNLADELEFPPTKAHYEQAADSSKFNLEQMRKRLGGSDVEALNKYESAMRNENKNKIIDMVETRIGNRQKLEPVEAGEKLITDRLNNYENTKAALKPQFEALENIKTMKQQHIPFLKDALQDVRNLSGRVAIDESGNIALLPFDPKMGITKNSYNSVKEVFDSINASDSLTFGDLKNYRTFLRDAIDPNERASAAFVNDVRKKLMDHGENLIHYYKPNQEVRSVFNQWRLNEEGLDKFKDLLNVKELGDIAPEKVLDKIFRDSRTAKEAAAILGPDEVKNLAGDFLKGKIAQATETNGVLSSRKFLSTLQKHRNSLEPIIGEQEFSKIFDRADLMRLIPDAPSPNPSGTAIGYKNVLEALGSPIQSATKRIGTIVDESAARTEFNKALNGGVATNPTKLVDKVVNVAQKTPQVVDKVSVMLKETPHLLGKFAPVLQKAAARGGQALAAAHFVLQQSNPEYRQIFSSDNNK